MPSEKDVEVDIGMVVIWSYKTGKWIDEMKKTNIYLPISYCAKFK